MQDSLIFDMFRFLVLQLSPHSRHLSSNVRILNFLLGSLVLVSSYTLVCCLLFPLEEVNAGFKQVHLFLRPLCLFTYLHHMQTKTIVVVI
jgi:hypothetical protein